MSLLNKMLRDLDQRRAAESERESLPGEVKPLPLNRSSSVLPWLAAGAALAAVAVVGGGLFWWAPWKPAVLAPLVAPQVAPQVTPQVAAPPQPLPVAPVQTPPSVPAPAMTGEVKPMAGSNANLRLDTALKGAGTAAAKAGKAEGTGPLAPLAAVDKTGPRKVEPAMVGNASGRVEKTLSTQTPLGQAEAEFRRAQGLLAQGGLVEAEAALHHAIILAPEHVAARQALFGLLLEQQRKDEARTLLAAGLAMLPGHTTWAMNLARLQMEKGDAAGAWETLQASLAGAQNNGEYQAFCGTVLQRLGRSKDAIEYFHAALRTNAGEGRWWLGLALVLESAGHPAEAREAFARAKASGTLPADLAAFADQKSR